MSISKFHEHIRQSNRQMITINNDDNTFWLGIGLSYNKFNKLALSLGGILDRRGKGIDNVIPVRTWHHICIEIDLNNQTLSAALDGITVIENTAFRNMIPAPSSIQVGIRYCTYFKQTSWFT